LLADHFLFEHDLLIKSFLGIPLVILLMVVLATISCGQKGDLYLPEAKNGEQTVNKKTEKKKELN